MILRTAHVPFTKPTRGERMSYEEFLDRVFDHNHYEWVDGEAVEMAEIEFLHAALVAWLMKMLGAYVDFKGSGVVLVEPFQMKTGPDLPGRNPDVMFISTANHVNLERKCLRGPADLVVEVASPSTRRVDRRDKFREYAAGGVGEYWMLDPHRKTADLFVREGPAFVPGEIDEDGAYHSPTFPGVTFPLDWFWTMPPLPDVLRAWKLI